MLKKLELKNFQGHKNSEVEFVPGVNTIIGTSDHGKSSLIRAIRWVNENKPGGTNNVSHWIMTEKGNPTDSSEVSLITDEDIIRRVRGPGTANEYHLNNNDLTAFGHSVPEEVTEALQIGEINFQKQEDSFFLLNASSGEIMRKVNKFVDLELIDDVLAFAESDLRKARSGLKHQQATLADTDMKLKPFEDLDKLEAIIETADLISDRIDESKASVNSLSDFIAKINTKQQQIDALGNIERIAKKVEKATELSKELEKLRDKKRTIQNETSRFRTLESNVPKIPKSVDRLISKAMETEKAIEDLEDKVVSIEEYIKRYKTHSDTISKMDITEIDIESLVKMSNSIEKLKNRKQEIIQYTSKLDTVEKDYIKIKKQVRKDEAEFKRLMPEVCPLCGSELEGCQHGS